MEDSEVFNHLGLYNGRLQGHVKKWRTLKFLTMLGYRMGAYKGTPGSLRAVSAHKDLENLKGLATISWDERVSHDRYLMYPQGLAAISWNVILVT